MVSDDEESTNYGIVIMDTGFWQKVRIVVSGIDPV